MKKKYIIFLFLLVKTAYSQAIICYGATKTYSVDTADGLNGTEGSTYAWQVKNTDGSVNTAPIITATTASGNTISINWGTTAAGNYTIEVVETNASCAAPAVTLSVNIKANPTVTASNTEVCLGSNKSIVATSSTSNPTDVFSWTAVPSGYTGTTNTNTISILGATAAMAGNYTVTVTDTNGCTSDPVTAILTVNPLPDATITAATSLEFCNGGSVVLSAPTGLSYIWNKDGTNLSPSETGGSYTASQAGSYTVTTTDIKGCSNTTNPAALVTVNPNPTVSVIASTNQFCDGSTATLTATTTAGTAPFTYQWINSSGNIATSGTNVSYVASITSNYSVKVTDSKGCFVTSLAQTISNRPNPVATITALTATTFCAGDSVVLQRGTATLSNHVYQWIKDAVDIASASTNFNYTATESGTYKVRVVDTNYTTNCTVTTPNGVIVTKTDLPVTSIITAY